MSEPAATRPAVYSIPTGVPFVDALAEGIVARFGPGLNDDPAQLADATVLLPTRRACRALRDAFLRVAAHRGAVLLPRLLPLGDMDEEELLLAGAFEDPLAGPDGGLGLAPAVSRLHRQFRLARLILARPDTDETPDQAVRLAQELARLLDQFHTERIDPAALKTLAGEDRDWAGHWQRTLTFLSIVTEHWPAILAADGVLDPAERRNKVLEAQAAEWSRNPPKGPVIAAGSTGTVPATADLLAVVARLPNGAVVLPGLDRALDDTVFGALPPSHPQYGLARLLGHLGVSRDDVADWPTATAATCPPGRLALLSRALLPAEATETWRADGHGVDGGALAGIVRIDADTQQAEAAAIALVLREALQTEGRTAALVTPDRTLARRVGAELTRFGLSIDDSAGTPLAKTAPGAFLTLTARLVAEGFAPVALLAAGKHPLAGLGLAPAALRRQIRAVERAALRGPRPGDGLDGLRRALDGKDRDLVALVDSLAAIAQPFAAILSGGPAALGDILRAHAAFAEAFAATDADSGATRLWAGEAGETLAGLLAELGSAGEALGAVAPASYPALLDTLLAGAVVRPRSGAHPRLAIWGPLEARLQHADVMVLGGLNEESWPPVPDAGPWMSRPMMESLGLAVPERRVGLAAHDFVQAMGAGQVYLTRARRAGGAPTVPSRWLVRLETLLDGLGLADAFRPDTRWTAWAAKLDEPDGDWQPAPVSAPRPCPPAGARPSRLSVTQVETWIRDPYAIYARHVLDLKPLDPLDADPGAAERGTVVHDALEAFIRAHKDAWPADPLAELLRFGRVEFQKQMAWPAVRAFWWPRFERIAAWFAAFESARRAAGVIPLEVEVEGARTVTTPERAFTLTARADRIDRAPGGGLSIVDYKTGRVPSVKQVKAGLAPQLALEAAIAEAGGFAGVAASAVADLTYVKVSGGREPGRETTLDVDAGEAAAKAWAGLERKVRAFESENTPYLSRVRAQMEAWSGDYDHLARVKEWSAGGEGGDE